MQKSRTAATQRQGTGKGSCATVSLAELLAPVDGGQAPRVGHVCAVVEGIEGGDSVPGGVGKVWPSPLNTYERV